MQLKQTDRYEQFDPHYPNKTRFVEWKTQLDKTPAFYWFRRNCKEFDFIINESGELFIRAEIRGRALGVRSRIQYCTRAVLASILNKPELWRN